MFLCPPMISSVYPDPKSFRRVTINMSQITFLYYRQKIFLFNNFPLSMPLHLFLEKKSKLLQIKNSGFIGHKYYINVVIKLSFHFSPLTCSCAIY